MNTLGDNADEGTVGGGGPVERTRTGPARARSGVRRSGTVTASLLGALAVLATVVLGGPAALAAQTDTAQADTGQADAAQTDAARAASEQAVAPSPSPTSTRAPYLGTLPPDSGRPGSPSPAPSDRPAVAPTIADPGDVTTATARFHGRGTPGHTVAVSGPSGTTATRCTTTVGSDGSWACLATLRSGPQQVFTVTDRTDAALGSASAPASDVIVPPTVTTRGATAGPVSGTAQPGATVTLSVSGPGGASGDSTTTAGRDGRWTLSLAAATGRDARLTVTATQTASTADGYRSDLRSASSAPQSVTLDRTAPTAPRITSPASGDRTGAGPVTVRGTGEADAVVTVYVDRAPVCRTEVDVAGRWSCVTSGAPAAGSRTVTATQQDAAGNFSPSSRAVRVVAGGPGGTPTGDPSASATGSSAPGVTTGPTSGHTPSAAAPGGGTPTGADGNGDGDGDGTSSGAGMGTTDRGGGSGGGVPDWSGPAGDWTASTAYDDAVPTIQASFSWRTVFVATAVAAGFLVLVAAPLALVGAAARGRLRNPFAGLLGRNRSRTERRLGDDVLPTWAAVAIAVGIVAVTTLLGVGVALEARYVRLAVAVLLGATVTTLAVVTTARWAAGADRTAVGFRVSPWLVLAALVACGVTRATDLSPALVIGVVLVPVGRPGADTGALRLGSAVASGVRGATARSTALLVVAALGWVVHSVTPTGGFWAALVSETATTVCVGGTGALVVSLLPVAGSAGATLLAGARGRYLGLSAGGLALAAAVWAGSGPAVPSTTTLSVAAALAGAATVVCWTWLRRSSTTPARDATP